MTRAAALQPPKTHLPAIGQVQLLDCTLRDGGYYNGWNFSRQLTSSYLAAVSAAGVNAIEIGFRLLPQDRFLGPFAYSTDAFLTTLSLPHDALIGVMVNAKELLAYADGADAALALLFQDATRSPVRLVRIAAHATEVARSEAIARWLKTKGYLVAVNLMQVAGQSEEVVERVGATVQGWRILEVLYFADSLGNMSPQHVTSTVRALRRRWSGPLGIHTHDNMGQALANSQAALAAGVTWLDGTIRGMGRGAGNAHTEHLLLTLKDRALDRYAPEAVFPIVMEEFEQLQKQHGWGPNLLYYLSAAYSIHPTFVQELLCRGHYDTRHILEALEFLKRSGAAAYTDEILHQALCSSEETKSGTWSADGWARGKTVIIVARGPGMTQHLEALCQFIDARSPVVIALNVSREFPLNKVTAFAACHTMRLLMDFKEYCEGDRPLIAPVGIIPEAVRANGFPARSLQILDYGLRVQPGTFDVQPTGCIIPGYTVAAYAMAVAEAAGAARILLVGFDGYGPGDPRSLEMSHIFRTYQARPTAVPLLAVTPTMYDVPKGSIYSPEL